MHSTDDVYWSNYDGLQHAKHQLLKNYLGGWFPILSKWRGKVVYIDSHAGRGRHATGQDGSPILAIKLLLNHRDRDEILEKTEVQYVFLEDNKSNYDCLCNEIASLGVMPKNINVNCFQHDYEDVLRNIIQDIRSGGRQLAPCFAFVDPYGFKIPMDLLNDFLSFEGCELLINFMYRYVDMAMQKNDQSSNMDALFGCQTWRDLIDNANYVSRSNEIIELFSKQLKASYVTHLKMRQANGALKYVLIHATNHRKGREVMKQAIWSVTPDGSFSVNVRYSPNQPVLIIPEPNLEPLKKALWKEFIGKCVSMKELYDWLLGEMYIKPHLHEIIRDYRNKKIIKADGFLGRFALDKILGSLSQTLGLIKIDLIITCDCFFKIVLLYKEHRFNNS